MKKIILALLVFGFGCESPKADKSVNTEKGYSILTIDSCEYIECDYGIFEQRVYSLTHKGNCIYCIQRNQQQ